MQIYSISDLRNRSTAPKYTKYEHKLQRKTEHQSGIFLIDISDHLPIFTITEHETKNPNSGSYTTRKIGKKSLELFANKIKSCDWHSTLSKHNPTESYESFFKEFFEIYDNYFPLKE